MSYLIPDTIKAVIFDFDDTLVGTHRPIWNMHRHIAKKYYGIDLDDETILKHWGQPINVLAKHFYQTDDPNQGIAYILAENSNFPKETFEHTIPVLKKLRDMGKKTGIVTASHLSLINTDFMTADLSKDIVDYIQTADDTDVHKPDPAVFNPLLDWAREHGIRKDEILYIGDGLHDMTAAQSAGLNFLGVASGLVTVSDFRDNNADGIIDLSILL
jgi:HAD superfamily hydrolase (TIGR01549 family)